MKEYIDIPFEIKSVDEDGTIRGLGSVFDNKPDDYNDIVVKGAFKESIKQGGRNGNGFPMLWQHKSSEPIGKWLDVKEINEGLDLVGRLTRGVTKAEDAYLLIKDRAIQGLSIGYDTFNGIVEIDNSTGIRYLKKVNLWEISVVTFPAKTSAVITNVKNIKEARNERELERALRDAGLSINASKVVVSMAKHSLKRGKGWDILKALREVNAELEIRNYLNRDEKKVIPFKSYSLAAEGTPWDGPGEVKKADVKDLKKMCTWYDAENEDIKSAYKLPHHKADGYTTVWRGVRAAMGALLGARGGVQIPDSDKKGVYNHLSKHYKEFEKTPPDFKNYSQEELKIFEDI